MKHLALVALAVAACHSTPSSAPAKPAPARPAAAAPASTGPVWIGVVFVAGTAKIDGVIPGSPAAKAGLQRGETIVSVDGHPVTTGREVPPLVQQHPAGSTIAIQTDRATVNVEVQSRPNVDTLAEQLVGKPAPAVELPLFGGGRVSLAGLRGHIVVLDFWATWCGPCVAEIPHYEELQRRMPDVRVLGVSTEDDASLRAVPTKYPVAVDEEARAWRDYLVMVVPTTFVIDERGIVRHVELGYGDPNAIDKAIASLRSSPSP